MNVSITVDVEEWFHSNWFDSDNIIKKYYNAKEPETDVLNKTKELIELFDNNNAKSTFFLLGETAAKYPELIDILEESQHEFACHGYYHNKTYSDKDDFLNDIKRYKNEIKSDIKGFRFPNFDYNNKKLEILVKEGFSYDSSVVPCLKIPGWYGESNAPLRPYLKNLGDKISIMELPLSVMPHIRLPGSGGWFLRNIGYLWTKILLKSAIRSSGYGMLYIHPWELSDNNPKFKEIPFHVFRNTGNYTLKSIKKIIDNLSECNFITLFEQIKLSEELKNR